MTKITTNTHRIQDIIVLIFLFLLIDYWIFFISLLVIGKQSLFGWIVAASLSILVDTFVYLRETIYVVSSDEFIIKRRLNIVFKDSKLSPKEKHVKVDEVFHALIDVQVNLEAYTNLIHVRFQRKEKGADFFNFAILEDKEFKSFIQFLFFLKEKQIGYNITNNKNRKLIKLLKENDL